jgi:hypothetical protein
MHRHLLRARPGCQPHRTVAKRERRRLAEKHGLDNEGTERKGLEGGHE